METTLDVNATAVADSADNYLAVGTLLHNGRYRIERQLASGGFGKTYVVTDLTFERTVVVKEFYIKGTCVRMADNTVTVSQADNAPLFDAQRTKFRKEAKRLYDLDHPNIVRIHDLFDENGTSYYTMDYVEGESLRDRVKSCGPIAEQEVWPILTQLLDALAYIHERHIWHLDLKPANVLVDASGHVTLIDFGASKLIDNDSDGSTATSTSLAYTPGYAPLEQESRDFKNFGPWTDFYALGATLYNLVTAKSVPTTNEVVSEGEEAFSFLPETSAKLRKQIAWMMKPIHKDRPQSVKCIKDALETAGEKEVLEAASDDNPIGCLVELVELFLIDLPVELVKYLAKKWYVTLPVIIAIAVGIFWHEYKPHFHTDVTGTDSGHEYVDLGLPSGTLWATCNVGASSPYQMGDRFAWGETKPKKTYDWRTYKHCEGNENSMKNYVTPDTILSLSDDAAHCNWGGNWQMPTAEQIGELVDQCSWREEKRNGVMGYVVESIRNDNSIFLPMAGDDEEYEAFYWSSALGYQSPSAKIIRLYKRYKYDEFHHEKRDAKRCDGCFVRPVLAN